MNNRDRYLIKNTAVLALGKIGTKLIAFFLVPLYTYALSAQQYGTIDLLISINTILMPLLILNISESIIRFCLDQDADWDKIMSIAWLILIGAVLFGLLLIPVSEYFPDTKGYGLWLYGYILSAAASQVFLSYLRGQEKLLDYSAGNILYAFLTAAFNILFLVVFNWEIKGYLFAYICANTLTAIYAICRSGATRIIKNMQLDFKLAGEMLQYSTILIPNLFLWWIINSSDRVMITAMLGAAANGIYAISYKIPSMLSVLSEAFNQAWSYSAIRQESSLDKEEYTNQMYHNLVQVLTMVAAAVLLFIKPFLRIYVSDEYYEAWRYTPYLLFAYVFLTLSTFAATSYTVHKDNKGYLFSVLCGALMNIPLNFFLIPRQGIMGAALATCISYFGVYLFRVLHTRKYIRLHVCRNSHLISAVLLIFMSALLFTDSMIGLLLQIPIFLLLIFCCRDFLKALLLFAVNWIGKKADS